MYLFEQTSGLPPKLVEATTSEWEQTMQVVLTLFLDKRRCVFVYLVSMVAAAAAAAAYLYGRNRNVAVTQVLTAGWHLYSSSSVEPDRHALGDYVSRFTHASKLSPRYVVAVVLEALYTHVYYCRTAGVVVMYRQLHVTMAVAALWRSSQLTAYNK